MTSQKESWTAGREALREVMKRSDTTADAKMSPETSPEQERPGSRRHARRPPGVVNSLVLAMLRSPLRRLLSTSMCEVSYLGRRTGRRVSLPVLFAADHTRVVVLAGDAPDKRWWRNFTAPGPIEVRRGGRIRTGTARIVPPDDPAYASAWQLYTKRHHIAGQPTDRLLLIETHLIETR
jgi:hypothetical protein